MWKHGFESHCSKQKSHEYRSPKDSHGTWPSFTRSTCNIPRGDPDVKLGFWLGWSLDHWHRLWLGPGGVCRARGVRGPKTQQDERARDDL